MAEFGKSILGILDVDADLSFGDGNLALAHDLCRRLVTEPGGLLDDPAYGYGLQLLLSSPVDALSVQRKVASQCLQDERVEDVQVDVTQNLATQTIVVEIAVETAEGPFALTMTISQLTIEVLLPNGETFTQSVSNNNGSTAAAVA